MLPYWYEMMSTPEQSLFLFPSSFIIKSCSFCLCSTALYGISSDGCNWWAPGDRTGLRDTAVHALPPRREHRFESGHSQNAPQEEDALRASVSGPTPPQRARPSRPGKVRNILWTDSARLRPRHLTRRAQGGVFFCSRFVFIIAQRRAWNRTGRSVHLPFCSRYVDGGV